MCGFRLKDEGAELVGLGKGLEDSNGVAVNFEETKVITVKNRQMVVGFKLCSCKFRGS